MRLKTLAMMGAICASLVFTSCKKNDDGDDKKEEPTPATVIGNWKITAFTITDSTGGADSVNNYYALWLDCRKDDLHQFNIDQSFFQLEGATKCLPQEPDTVVGPGSWALLNNNTKLKIIQGAARIYDITTLNVTTLKIQSIDTVGDRINRINVTLTRQ